VGTIAGHCVGFFKITLMRTVVIGTCSLVNYRQYGSQLLMLS